MRIFFIFYLIVSAAVFAVSQENSSSQYDSYRGSIPEELLRPGRGEAPYYPADMIIGSLGRGNASEAAFSFAASVASALTIGAVNSPALSSVNSAARDRYLSALRVISPGSYRLGGGREEADGAFSFLIRFIGPYQGITGEMYIRYVTRHVTVEGSDEPLPVSNWVLEDLYLEEAMNRDVENQQSIYRSDFYLYERFY